MLGIRIRELGGGRRACSGPLVGRGQGALAADPHPAPDAKSALL